MAEQLAFPAASAAVLERRLPPPGQAPDDASRRPFVTLTFATSLDSTLSLAPGVRTRLSGPESKAMTHYLRSRHAAILVGVSTVLADDPALNCRIAGTACQPRPVILDPHLRWTPSCTDKVFEVSRAGAGLAPFVLTGVPAQELPRDSVELLHQHGGKFIHVRPSVSGAGGGRMRFDWRDVLDALLVQGLSSVMVEGGGQVINSLLDPAHHELVDSVIVTVAPTWLGQGGTVVSPDRVLGSEGSPVPAARLADVSWHPFGEDVVLCGRLRA
ncbi:2,5-diamino-6-ribosylamino-4(3H)-pyrimidinone 5'-phosphate reductase [Hirsutella rhossiliensis]|uniref:2,5-diamino-6-ribosylamino-4(3H)-pyrimidinone 5'-phosphate reductase n=1 Tax=Hirsutella rhossiliensis TaxID=111463 RepID=A0A9P8SM06_9HYPO|nr:2,5-diamino-6-ribosylamino-4(3H)-pyrimidinone 5'-phosphate reductase [Hirsutella rhossiliensis]KAH0965691.1 2,5-diamino-6-ribosylamino-4(3H)-pyrimidinone 5'-phosphate reductase [Hirsutella rhossiliensis]